MEYTEFGNPIMPTSAVQVAAAMVAVVAEQPTGYSSQASYLRGRRIEGGQMVYSTGCIQGAMLEKLGYYNLPDTEGVNSGDYETVMAMLGQADEYADVSELPEEKVRLRDALSLAQSANDSRLPWSAALEAFERCMAGEDMGPIYALIRQAGIGLRKLRTPKPVSETCPCGCDEAVVGKLPPANKFQPSWTNPIFQKAVDAEMASMKKFIELANKPIAPVELKYVSFPVVSGKDPVKAFADLATV